MRLPYYTLVPLCALCLLSGCSGKEGKMRVRADNDHVTAGYTRTYEEVTPTTIAKKPNNEIEPLDKTNPPTYRVNQKWIYKDANNMEFYRHVIEVGHDYYIIRYKNREIKYDKNLDVVAVLFPPDAVKRKHDADYHFPLYVGKTWDYDTDIRPRNGKIYTVHVTNEVKSFGEITVAAGQFKAYKIYQQVNVGNVYDTSYYWYAPDVGAIIKRTYRSRLAAPWADSELVSFSK